MSGASENSDESMRSRSESQEAPEGNNQGSEPESEPEDELENAPLDVPNDNIAPEYEDDEVDEEELPQIVWAAPGVDGPPERGNMPLYSEVGRDEHGQLLEGNSILDNGTIINENGQPLPFWPLPVPDVAATLYLHSRTVRILIRLQRKDRKRYQRYFQEGGHARKVIYPTVFAIDQDLRHVFGPETLRSNCGSQWYARECHFRFPTVYNAAGEFRKKVGKILRDSRLSNGQFAPNAVKDVRALGHGKGAILASIGLGEDPIKNPDGDWYCDEDLVLPTEATEVYTQFLQFQGQVVLVQEHLIRAKNCAEHQAVTAVKKMEEYEYAWAAAVLKSAIRGVQARTASDELLEVDRMNQQLREEVAQLTDDFNQLTILVHERDEQINTLKNAQAAAVVAPGGLINELMESNRELRGDIQRLRDENRNLRYTAAAQMLVGTGATIPPLQLTESTPDNQ
ncbi:hypothetical protein BJX70DRAFT_129091 [Aspergillus crustosus]